MPATLTTDEQLKDLQVQIDRAKAEAKAANADRNEALLEVEKAREAVAEVKAAITAAEESAAAARAEAEAHAAVLEDAQTRAAKAEKAAEKAKANEAGTQESLDATRTDNDAAKAEIKRLTQAVERQDKELARLRPIAEAAVALRDALPA
jgi:chromosome segregation ATPase